MAIDIVQNYLPTTHSIFNLVITEPHMNWQHLEVCK